MKQSYTPDFFSYPNDQTQSELIDRLTKILKQSADTCKPGSMAVRNILGYAAALEVVSDQQNQKYQILVN